MHDNVLTENNNASITPYSGQDSGLPVAVSNNSIDINSSNVITSSNTTFTINMIYIIMFVIKCTKTFMASKFNH